MEKGVKLPLDPEAEKWEELNPACHLVRGGKASLDWSPKAYVHLNQRLKLAQRLQVLVVRRF